MSNPQVRAGFITPDGQVFTTAAEAKDYLRKPLVKRALLAICGNDANLASFLEVNEDEILKAFEVGVVARVTKSERNRLSKALEALKAIPEGKIKFLQDNAAAILDSFRWPSVKRMDDEEKAAATLEALTKLGDGNFAKWVVANRVNIEAAYEAGIEKRVGNPKAMEALAAARVKRAAQLAEAAAAKKAAAEAGTTEGGEPTDGTVPESTEATSAETEQPQTAETETQPA